MKNISIYHFIIQSIYISITSDESSDQKVIPYENIKHEISNIKNQCLDYLKEVDIFDFIKHDELADKFDAKSFEIPQTKEHQYNPILILHNWNAHPHLDTFGKIQADIKIKQSLYISGEVHGNETVGTTGSLKYIEYQCKYLPFKLNNMYIIITPITNVIGYANGFREEACKPMDLNKEKTSNNLVSSISNKLDFFTKSSIKYKKIDPNRDQPQNTKQCFKTLTSRQSFAIIDIFKPSVVLTLHGGIELFAWPWGSKNHIEDQVTYDNDLQEQLADQANLGLDWKGKTYHDGVKEVPKLGIINSGPIYPVDGSIEDMAQGIDHKEFKGGIDELCPYHKECQGDFKYFEKSTQFHSHGHNGENIAISFLYETQDTKDPIGIKLGSINQTHDLIEAGHNISLKAGQAGQSDSNNAKDTHHTLLSQLDANPASRVVATIHHLASSITPEFRIEKMSSNQGNVLHIQVYGLQGWEMKTDTSIEASQLHDNQIEVHTKLNENFNLQFKEKQNTGNSVKFTGQSKLANQRNTINLIEVQFQKVEDKDDQEQNIIVQKDARRFSELKMSKTMTSI